MSEAKMKFVKANQLIKSKVVVPTTMDSAELAMSDDFSAQVKAHCFFSAKVTSANILEALKKEVERFTAGETDMATARLRLKTFLHRQGVGYKVDIPTSEKPDGISDEEFKARKAITNIASTRRLNMILELNAKMAQAAARRAYDMHPDMLERFPNFVYDAKADARDGHKAFDGLVLPKEDPFWDTHTPPWEYGCRCEIYNSDKPVNAKTADINPNTQQGKLFHKGRAMELLPNPSGFSFRVDEAFKVANMGMVKGVSLRLLVLERLHELATKNKQKINAVNFQKGEVRIALVKPENISEVDDYLDELAGICQETGRDVSKFPSKIINLGQFLPSHREALGVSSSVNVEWGLQQTSDYGLKHTRLHHIKVMKSKDVMRSIFEETIWNANAGVSTGFMRNNKYYTIFHPSTGSYVLLKQVDSHRNFQVVSLDQDLDYVTHNYSLNRPETDEERKARFAAKKAKGKRVYRFMKDR